MSKNNDFANKFGPPLPQSTLKYRSKNRPCPRGLSSPISGKQARKPCHTHTFNSFSFCLGSQEKETEKATTVVSSKQSKRGSPPPHGPPKQQQNVPPGKTPKARLSYRKNKTTTTSSSESSSRVHSDANSQAVAVNTRCYIQSSGYIYIYIHMYSHQLIRRK